jgi:hypothetical protein
LKLEYGSGLKQNPDHSAGTNGAYLAAAQSLKEATGPYKAARDAYVAATATYTNSLYD